MNTSESTRASRRRKRAVQSANAVSPGPVHLITARQLTKNYHKASVVVPVLRGVDIAIRRGEFVSIIGQSGSGKSTLLHLLGTLDAPDSGQIHYEGQRIDDLTTREKDTLRNREIGLVFQFYHLLPELSALENVLLPTMIRNSIWSYWSKKRELRERARHLLEMVGLGHRLRHKPCELSGGEMQRVAIARALMAKPRLLLADEPTGNLDRENGAETMDLLRTLNQQEKLTIVMVTHDASIASQADRVLKLVEGRAQRKTLAEAS